MKLKDGAFLRDFCDSFRLLFHASNVLAGKAVCLHKIEEAEAFENNSFTREALDTLNAIYQVSKVLINVILYARSEKFPQRNVLYWQI